MELTELQKTVAEFIDAGYQLPAIWDELKKDGFTEKEIKKAMEPFDKK